MVASAGRLPFTGVAFCLFSSWSWQIILPVLERILADSSSQSSLLFRSFKPFRKVWGSGKHFFTDLVLVWRCQLAVANRGGSSSQDCYGYIHALAWSAQAPCQGISSQAHLLAMSLIANYLCSATLGCELTTRVTSGSCRQCSQSNTKLGHCLWHCQPNKQGISFSSSSKYTEMTFTSSSNNNCKQWSKMKCFQMSKPFPPIEISQWFSFVLCGINDQTQALNNASKSQTG